jgi:heptose I phosphotransferase
VPRPSAGRLEAENLRSLAALGIDVPRLVAFGQRLAPDGRLDSFLLTEELYGYCELQDFLQRRFVPCAQRPGGRDAELERLILQVASIARRFHAAGYNHRDLYSCHFLVKEVSPGRFDVRLIDLQRMQRRQWFRRRWIVKDLAQLASMLPADWVRCRDKVLFLRHYLDVARLRRGDKRLIRDVVRKQRLIQRRQGRGA